MNLIDKEVLDSKQYMFDDEEINSEKIVKLTHSNSGRRNYSFATKFCHYLCYYLFEGKKRTR